jgi:hypothetical protein
LALGRLINKPHRWPILWFFKFLFLS